MNRPPVVIVGGHAAVVADALLAEGRAVLGFVAPESGGAPGLGERVIRQGAALEDGVMVRAGAVVLNAGAGKGVLIGVPARRRGLS